MIAKVEVWDKYLSHGELDSFPSLHNFMDKSSEDLDGDVLRTMTEHLECFKTGLRKYFPELANSFE
jgi:hypothetical protein